VTATHIPNLVVMLTGPWHQAFLHIALLDVLNRNASAIQAITTVVLVAVTAWYVFLTRQMVQAARRSQRPYVYIDITSEGGVAGELRVTNYGERVAENVSFEVVREFDDFHGNPISHDTPLARGIRYLPPGRSYRFHVLLPDDLTAGPPGTKVLDVKTSYSYAGALYEDRLTIDFADLESVLITSFQSSNDHIATSLRDIAGIMRRREIPNTIRRTPPQLKSCPVCSEMIRSTAKKCPKCREWLPNEEPDDSEPDAARDPTEG
jgi:predicted Zn-ribbon and HTH transcriptional regulator